MSKKAQGVCPQCGKNFSYWLSTMKGKPKVHCSRKCQSLSGRVSATCPVCSVEFSRHKSEPSVCCSRKCADRHKEKDENYTTFACYECGKEVRRLTCQFNGAEKYHFCGRQCFAAWMARTKIISAPRLNRVRRSCEICEAEFDTIPSEVAMGWARFCSRKCCGVWMARTFVGENSAHWRGGYDPYYGPNWSEQRRQVRARDNYTCQRCGVTESQLERELDVHHVMPFRTFGRDRYAEANNPDNLKCYCAGCHQIIEHCKAP
jgi:hypothetical protein